MRRQPLRAIGIDTARHEISLLVPRILMLGGWYGRCPYPCGFPDSGQQAPQATGLGGVGVSDERVLGITPAVSSCG